MELLKFPHPNLFKVCKPVSVFGPELKVLLDNMWDIMINAQGVGLAANQVGLDYRMFILKGAKDERYYMVNPEIVNYSVIGVNLTEGCLSAPGEFLKLSNRFEWVECKYQDETGRTLKATFFGLYSVAVQHELEHLDGKTFLTAKHLPRNKRKELAKKWGLT